MVRRSRRPRASGLLAALVALILLPASGAAIARVPDGFVYLRDVDPTILQDMRYAGAYNFTGAPVPGYQAAECVLRREVALALKTVQSSLKQNGYSLKVYDCYRPDRAVKAFGRWAGNLKDQSTKDYYPRMAKSALYGKGYIARRSSHSRGYAIDLTLVRLPAGPQPAYDPAAPRSPCTAPKDQLPPDNGIDMGTAFDCFDMRSHTDNRSISPLARANRNILRNAMTRFGFRNYRREWWHYHYAARRFPRTYHDFPITPRP